MSDLNFPVRLEANRGVAESIRRLLKARGIDARVTKRRWLVEVNPTDADQARDILAEVVEMVEIGAVADHHVGMIEREFDRHGIVRKLEPADDGRIRVLVDAANIEVGRALLP